MTHKPKKHEKSIYPGRGIRGSEIGIQNEHVGIPFSSRSTSFVRGDSDIHVLSKEDIESELSQIEKKYGMTSDEFHTAWKEGRVHGHEALKLGSYYEFYKDEYE
jgi:hypothetical protein